MTCLAFGKVLFISKSTFLKLASANKFVEFVLIVWICNILLNSYLVEKVYNLRISLRFCKQYTLVSEKLNRLILEKKQSKGFLFCAYVHVNYGKILKAS